MLNVLLTNDDGIEAEGLQELRRALVSLENVRLAVVAPDGNRSAMARSITTRRPLWVEETPFEDGTVGYATDGTPVDCVRLASLGLIEGFTADIVIAGINHGANLGDDITYSGTVAAALEGIVLGIPAIAVSQQSRGGELDWSTAGSYDFGCAATFVARLVTLLERTPHLLQAFGLDPVVVGQKYVQHRSRPSIGAASVPGCEDESGARANRSRTSRVPGQAHERARFSPPQSARRRSRAP